MACEWYESDCTSDPVKYLASHVPLVTHPAFVACSTALLQAIKAGCSTASDQGGRSTASNKSWTWRPGLVQTNRKLQC